MLLTEQKIKNKSNQLIKQLLEGTYAPSTWKAIPDINDQSQYLLNLAIFSAKKGIDNFDIQIGELKPQYVEKMITAGVSYMKNKITENDYIKLLEKCLSKQAGQKIELQDVDKLNIEIRLKGNKNYPKINNVKQ